jgi:hypothetical protein
MTNFLILTSGGSVPPPPPSLNPIGVNLFALGIGSNYGEGFPIYKNRFREGYGPFVTGSAYPGTLPLLNAEGWPTEEFSWAAWATGTGSNSQASWVEGNWSCGFTGSGAETVTSLNGTTISNLVQSGGVTTFTMSGVGNYGGFTVGNVTQAVTNIFAYLPEYNSLNTIDNPLDASAITTEALAHFGKIGIVRAMQWTNVIREGTTMTSSNRATPSNTQAAYTSWRGANGTVEGVPSEWTAAIALASGVASWINVGPVFDSSFTAITALANALYALVPAGNPMYIEIGNELWLNAGAGYTAWQNAASAYGSKQAYWSYQAHSIAAIFRGVFGSRYGTDVRLVLAWQQGGNGVYMQYLIYGYYASQGWSISEDLYCTSCAPYYQTGLAEGSTDTVAQILSAYTTNAESICFNAADESFIVMGLKYGLPCIGYEGGPQVNSEPGDIENLPGALMNSGMATVDETFYQSCSNAGFYGLVPFADGVNSGNSYSATGGDTNYCPINQFDYSYSDLLAGNSPRWNAILAGWPTPTRNVVSGSGSIISGNCYLNSNSGSNPTLNESTYPPNENGVPAPNYEVQGEIAYLINCTRAGIYTLVVNFDNTGGSSGTTGCEYGGNFNPYTVIAPTVSIPTGTNNVTVGGVELVAGANYIVLGNPGSNQADITVNSLTFN